MESLPTEILDHIFNQFPNKCEICQMKCLRTSLRQELSTYSKTSERWNRIIEEKIKDLDKLKKCYSDFEDLHAVTLNIQQEEIKRLGIGILQTTENVIGISIKKNSPLNRDGRPGYMVLQVNDFIIPEKMDVGEAFSIIDHIEKLNCVRFVVGQKNRVKTQKFNFILTNKYHFHGKTG